jgi:AraC-like DNA-binding protein
VTIETLISAARLGSPEDLLSAPLRCGASDLSAGGQRGFLIAQYACCWIAAGSGRYRDDAGRLWPLAVDTVFQRFPGRSHDILATRPMRVWFAAVPAGCLEALRQVGTPTLAEPVFSVAPDRLRRTRFAAAARRLRTAPEDALGACLAELLTLIAELHCAARPEAARPHQDAVAAACRLIAADPARRWTAPGLARAVGLGHHAFRKAFARQRGCGPLAWVLRQRLLLAQELLDDPRSSVAAVAARVGYDDPLHFSAIFRRHCGLSPRRWLAQRT